MHRKETFDTAADTYERARPGYTAALVDAVLEHIPERPVIRALEIGCGTGQATSLFANLNIDLLCIDIGANLLAVAKEKFKDKDNVRFDKISFEELTLPEFSLDLVYAATSWHWVDPAVKYKRAGKLLAPSGILAVISTAHTNTEDGFFRDVQTVYERIAPELILKTKPPEPVSENTEPMCLIDERDYPWSETYSAEEYVKLLGTYSDHLKLPEDQREMLFSEILEFTFKEYAGTVKKEYSTGLHIYGSM
ncbi:class I SAM-dependent methyltransferase [Candidatus Hydrogenedentota bacterium]